ncbi:enoyl-CoA hydratase [Aestuariivirga litoralis]|uniref:Enoyl-CoA hydratase domain-containing protein 3, mitochondrial n=1 Tax=Aestuariivirga litoralis TaxID=2650924 RepID=A0A2W2ALA6_9HYPH|nr:enoyl-CoA hydratase [Aestuariivirga litoralis]PZF76335.1 enoyl-CoA hydratase [Aestuariivirga litoralis]
MSSLLRSALAGGVLRLTLADAATRNSLSEAMMGALRAALAEAAGDRSVRVIVLAAEGPAFSSGHNLKEITAHRADPDKGAAYFATLFDSCAALMLGIVNHPKPVIAEVAGLASAAGCQLVASCDLAIAAEGARFCTPGVNIGLFCSTPMVALSRNVASKHAMEMLLTGDVYGAEDAQRFGLVNRVVPAADLTATVNELAAKIASKSMVTLRTGKQAFYRQRDLPLAEAYAYTARVMTENLLMRDAEEGIAAFIGKRDPQWSDEP